MSLSVCLATLQVQRTRGLIRGADHPEISVTADQVERDTMPRPPNTTYMSLPFVLLYVHVHEALTPVVT